MDLYVNVCACVFQSHIITLQAQSKHVVFCRWNISWLSPRSLTPFCFCHHGFTELYLYESLAVNEAEVGNCCTISTQLNCTNNVSLLSLFNILNSFQWCHKLTCQATQTNRVMLWKHHSVSLSKEVFEHWTNHITNAFCCQRCWRFSATHLMSCCIHASGTEVEETAHLSSTVLLFKHLFVGSTGSVSYSLFDFYYCPYFFPACRFMCPHVSGMCICGRLNCCNLITAICRMWSAVGWWMDGCFLTVEAHY